MDMYQTVTNRIVEAMESEGGFEKMWSSTSMPFNGSTGKTYRGINVLLLWISGYHNNEWYTYKQAAALGAHVRKGEKGTQIFFFAPNRVMRDADGNRTKNESDAATTSTFPVMRSYTVFNRDQIEGLAEYQKTGAEVDVTSEKAEALLEAMQGVIQWGAGQACYVPSQDVIAMPKPADFKTQSGLYAVAFHEIAHWTGHKSRLDRNLTGRFGDDAYAFEELIAEIASAFLCAEYGVVGAGLQHPQYVKNWLTRLNSDKYAVFAAAREAAKVADYIRDNYGLGQVDAEGEEVA